MRAPWRKLGGTNGRCDAPPAPITDSRESTRTDIYVVNVVFIVHNL